MIVTNDYDRYIYERELKNFLPDKMFDAHVHISTVGLKPYGSHNGGSSWTDYLPKDLSVAQFLDFSKQMFPNQEMKALIFGMCLQDIEETNKFVIKDNQTYQFPMLYRSDYAMDPDELEANVKAGGFRKGGKRHIISRDPRNLLPLLLHPVKILLSIAASHTFVYLREVLQFFLQH